jgi:hypothetical protein
MRYIGRKHGLLGKSEEEMIRVDMMAEVYQDLRNGLFRLSYNPNFVSTI